MFAIMYFGIMIDVGLFDPLVRVILRVLGDDPAKVVARHRDARRRGLARRRRLDDVHHHHRRDAADLPAPRHEPGGPDLRRRPRERHAQHRPVGRADRPRRQRAAASRPPTSSCRCSRRSLAGLVVSWSSPGSWACRERKPPRARSNPSPRSAGRLVGARSHDRGRSSPPRPRRRAPARRPPSLTRARAARRRSPGGRHRSPRARSPRAAATMATCSTRTARRCARS